MLAEALEIPAGSVKLNGPFTKEALLPPVVGAVNTFELVNRKLLVVFKNPLLILSKPVMVLAACSVTPVPPKVLFIFRLGAAPLDGNSELVVV